MKTRIRPACQEDADRLAGLSSQLGYPSTSEDVTRRLSELLSRPDHAVFVAEGKGGVVGWVHVFSSLTVETDRFAEIGGLVVDEGQRSRGIGKTLMERAEAWARQHSLPEVRLRSNVVRAEAHRFYRSIGYEIIKTQATFRKML